MGADGSFTATLSGPIRVYRPLQGRELGDAAVADSAGHIEIDDGTAADVRVMQSWLKLAESIKFELVPGNDMYLDKKTFTWQLKKYTENGMDFKIHFAHPSHISVGDPDTMKITFHNCATYMTPQDERLATIPEGFEIAITLPPQGRDVLSNEKLQSVKKSG